MQHTRVGVLKRRLTTSAAATFLQVFVMYPGLTNKIFEVFLCRDLGPDFTPGSVMHADYGVDCDETAALRYLGGGALVLLWPIGLPAGLDEGLLSLSLSTLLYVENPYSYKKFQ